MNWKKCIIEGTSFALILSAKMSLFTLVIFSYIGGLVALDKLLDWTTVSSQDLFTIQLAGALSAFGLLTAMFVIMFPNLLFNRGKNNDSQDA